MLCRTREDVDDVRREVQIMHHLKGHDNIVTLIGAYEDKQSIHLVSTCCFLQITIVSLDFVFRVSCIATTLCFILI